MIEELVKSFATAPATLDRDRRRARDRDRASVSNHRYRLNLRDLSKVTTFYNQGRSILAGESYEGLWKFSLGETQTTVLASWPEKYLFLLQYHLLLLFL